MIIKPQNNQNIFQKYKNTLKQKRPDKCRGAYLTYFLVLIVYYTKKR